MSHHGATVLDGNVEIYRARVARDARRAAPSLPGRAAPAAGAGFRGAASALDQVVENLPPFWLVFLFTVAVSLLPAMLVLPLAIAAIGLLPGLALLIAVGGISLLTMAQMAEAVTRSRHLRYGCAFLGRLVEEYLGPGGSRWVAHLCIVRTFLLLLVPILALALTLTSLLGLRPDVWVGLLLLLILFRLRHQEDRFSVTAIVALGTINLGLILILSLLALAHFQAARLAPTLVTALWPSSLSAPKLGVALGVFFCCFTGHLSVLQRARVVLPRDPDGRALISGTIAATAFVTLFLCLWAVAVSGALPASLLARERGTVLVPLAARFGPSVAVLGSLLACLMLGRCALGGSELLFYLMRERLSAREGPARCGGGRKRARLATWRGENGSWGWCVVPTVLAFGVVEALLRNGVRSLTEVTSVAGLLAVAVSGGILPPLLLLASRRKGEVAPGLVLPALGRPLVTGGIYVLFLAMLLAHGMFLWQALAARAAALGTAAAIVGATALLVRRGAFAPRLVLELREERTGEGAMAGHAPGCFDVVASGQPVPAAVRLEYAHGDEHLHAAAGGIASLAGLRGAEFRLPVERVRELKVWAHRVTTEGHSESLAGMVEVECGGATGRFPLEASGGKILCPVAGATCRVRVTLAVSRG